MPGSRCTTAREPESNELPVTAWSAAEPLGTTFHLPTSDTTGFPGISYSRYRLSLATRRPGTSIGVLDRAMR